MNKRHIAWITTNRACNLRCKWCYARATNFSNKNQLTLPLLKSILTLLKPFPIKNLVLIGGEPTIHPQFLDFLSVIREQKYSFSLVTNGLVFKDNVFLKKSIALGLKNISLSLKAPSNDKYREWTGVSALTDFSKAVENIRKNNLAVMLSLVITTELIPYIQDLIYLLKDLKIDKIHLDAERPAVEENTISYETNIATLLSGVKKVINALEKNKINYDFKASFPFCLYPHNFLNNLKKKGLLKSACQMVCASGLVFDTNGDLLACNQLCNYPLAVYGKDFKENYDLLKLISSKEITEFYQKMASYPNIKCKNCPEWAECGGGCRINWLYKNMLTN